MTISRTVFYKETFEKISSQKKDQIFTAAIDEFATKGFNAANINTIAKKAKISIGSLYSYFDSKEHLFLAMAEKGYELLDKALEELHPKEGTIFQVIERLLYITIRYAQKHKDLCRIYIDLSTESLAHLSERLSEKVETSYADVYRELLKRAIEKGEVRPDLDIPTAAFFLDNIVVMLQFSIASSYYRSRMKLYLGKAYNQNHDQLVANLLHLIRKALT